MVTQQMHVCPICCNEMTARVSSWNFYCRACDYWSADLPYDIASESDDVFKSDLNGMEAISFLDAIRVKNFNIILDRIAEIVDNKPIRILDVGCATGLFIQMASLRGYFVCGIEPNPKMAFISKNKGLNVVNGYFPDAIANEDEFDIIIFNDVFEHIPELKTIITGVQGRLKSNGIFIINLPTSDGFFFNLGRLFYKLKIVTLWDRLWQKMFYTPHLHYFNVSSLNELMLRSGFNVRSKQIELSVFSISGLWARISADKNNYFFKNLIIYFSVVLINPFLLLLPKDTVANFYSKK